MQTKSRIIMDEHSNISPEQLQDIFNKLNLAQFDNPRLTLKRLKVNHDWPMCLVLEDEGVKNG